MNLRDLLIGVGFKVNESSVANAEAKITKVKDRLGEVEDKSTKASAKTSSNIAQIGSTADRVGEKLDAFIGRFNALLAFAGVSLSLGSIIQTVDEWRTLEGQINNVTQSVQESKATQKELYDIAGRTRQQYEATAGMFISVSRSAKELGKTNKDVLAFTEDVSNAMLLGGGSAQAQQAALTQLGQALASGTLRGDELNSVMEQAPRLTQALTDALGVSRGELRKMAMEGKLTAVQVFDAIRSQSERLKMEMGKMPWTFEQATNKMSNVLGNFFKKVEDRTGVVSTLAQSWAKLADVIDSINVDHFVTGMQMLVIYATAFFVVSKWGAMVRGAQMLLGVIYALRNAYLAATGATVAFKVANGSVVSLLAMGKFLLIAAAITAVILVLQDLYTWINGGDSIMGRFFGSWDEYLEGLRNTWDSVTKSIDDFLNMRIIDIIKSAIGWIGELQDSIAKLNIREKIGDWWDENVSMPVNGFIAGVGNGAAAQGPELNPAQQAAYARLIPQGYQGGSRTVNDNRQNTNYINVKVDKTNASAEDIGNAVADKVGPQQQPDGYGFDELIYEQID